MFLIFSVVWSFKTSAITSIKIKTEDKKFLPIFPKTLLFFRYLVLFMIRVTCIVSYFSPFMGLLGTMNHYQARRIKKGDTLGLLNSYFCQKWALWSARPVLKKSIMNYKLLLRAVFFMSSWEKILFS